MGVCKCGRAKSLLLAAAILMAAFSDARSTSVHAQEPEPALRWDGLIELISGAYWYAPPVSEPPVPADGPSHVSRHAISGDGRYIVFNADAPSLGYSAMALYMRDRRTNETLGLLGGPALDPVISADGNHVAYKICDPWMRPDQQPICDIWTMDVRTRAWAVLSVTPDGWHGDGDSSEPVLSADGRFVVFRTVAFNLVSEGSAGVPQLVFRDRDADGNGVFDESGTAVVETISVDGVSGLVAGNGPSETAEISDDGRYVAFRSLAGNLVTGDTNGVWDVFRRDRMTRETVRINTRPDGRQSPVSVDSAAISMTADGESIAFVSADGLLGAGAQDDTNNAIDVYIYEASRPDWLRRVDIGEGWPAAGQYVPGNLGADWPSLSADGRYVALQSASTNVAVPPPSGTSQVYVVDLRTGVPTRISVRPDGTQPDADAARPTISADGTLVAFVSPALNLSPNVTTSFDRVYAAVHFSVAPAEVSVPGGTGGVGTFTITTQQHTQWWVDWTDWAPWVQFDSPPALVGTGELRLKANQVNYDSAPRTATIRIFDQHVRFTQLSGLSITSVSPESGPEGGGTVVTFRGTGFEPGMTAYFDGMPAANTTVLDPTTLVATAPAHGPATVWVGVLGSESRNAWIDQAYRYTDGTPPTIWPWVDGYATLDGWYTTDAAVNFWISDEHSAITHTAGCETTVVNADTAGTTFTCTAASEGGTATASVTVRRDTTGPLVSIKSPTAGALYEWNSVVRPEYTCSDAGSAVAQCGEGPDALVDTSQPGWRTHDGYALDAAGNPGMSSVEYGVSYGYCIATSPNLRLWFELEGDTRDSVHGYLQAATMPSGTPAAYVNGIVGRALWLAGGQFLSFGYPELPDLTFSNEMTLAAWTLIADQTGEAATIASKEDQFRVARFPDGTVRWAFANSDTGFAWVDTGATIPTGRWTHLVVTYDHGVVKTYINERLVHTHTGSGPMEPAVLSTNWASWISLGNRLDPAHPSGLVGGLDEVQLLDRVWQPSDVTASFFSGAQGMCKLGRTELLTEPATAPHGSAAYVARAQLRDADTSLPLEGRALRIESRVGEDGAVRGTATLITDENGWITWTAPMNPDAPPADYSSGFSAYFDGDSTHGGARGTGQVTVGLGTPVLAWAAPAAIVYGTPLGSNQLNASANTSGAFTYTPDAGTVLAAGQHELSVRFDPSTTYWQQTVSQVRLDVLKADPQIDWAAPADIVYGTPLDVAQLNATASVAGAWTYSPAAGTLLNAGAEQMLTATFTPADTANYNSVSATRLITVARVAPSLEVTAGTFTYDGLPHPASATARGLAGVALEPLTITYNGSSSVPVNAGSYAVVASFEGNANYSAASATATLTIGKASAVLTWSQPGGITYGTVLGAQQLGAVASIDGTFTYSPATGTLLDAGPGQTLSATFSPADATNYQEGTVATTIDVVKARPELTVTGGSFTYDGSAHPATAALTGVDGEPLGPVALTYNGTGDQPVNAGVYAAVGSYAGNGNYEAASATTTITIAKAAVSIAWSRPAPIVYGTPLGTTQLNASAPVPGAMVFSPAPGTVLNAGAGQSLSATFVAIDESNYTGATVAMTIDVMAAPLAIVANDASKRYGAPMPVLSAAVNGFVNGDSVSALAGSLTFYTPATQHSRVGTYPIVVSGVNSANYAITFLNGTLTVERGNVAISVATSPEPSGAGQPITFTASVSPAVQTVTRPAGVVRFFDGSTLVGSAPLAEGVASVETAGLDAGSRTIEARYEGDVSFEAGVVSAGHVIHDAASTPSISVASSRNPSNVGQTVTLSALVSRWGAAVSGIVDFYDGAAHLGSASILSGRATLTTTALAAGSHAITVRYRGGGDVPPVRSNILVQAVGAPGWKDRASSVALVASTSTVGLGESVTFTATVTGFSGSVPTGFVLFMVNGDVVGEVAVSAMSATTARAAFTVHGLNHGRHTVSATYVGDHLHKGSTASVTQTVD